MISTKIEQHINDLMLMTKGTEEYKQKVFTILSLTPMNELDHLRQERIRKESEGL
jgi:hypothetical protein